MAAIRTWIESKNWEHLKFLRSILLIVLLVILMMYFWLFFLIISQNARPDIVQLVIQEMLTANLFGIIAGILLGFGLLLPFYLKQEWDLHRVVPSFMFYFLVVLVMLQFSSLFVFPRLSQIFKLAFLTGLVVGGFIAIIAYVGEVVKEHQEEEPLLE